MITLPVLVTKYDGTQQPFDRNKVIQTLIRMGATTEAAESIVTKIESNLYDGIETKKILQMVFKHIRKHKPVTKHKIDLRKALSMLGSQPGFERFVQVLLREHGYDVSPNQIVRGRCVEHEVDAIARKDGKTAIVEVKHHYRYHTRTNLDVSRISRAVFEDVTEGYADKVNDLKIDYPMIVCNTKLTDHAKRYADCRGIRHIGWSAPKNGDLQSLIEQKKAYPVTFLNGLNAASREKLVLAGIVLLKQFAQTKTNRLRKITGLSFQKLDSLLVAARAILSEM
ncbi:MAG: ATP cone domain-containing protein [Candidatus Bathyarchaeota archaeon]|nr:ATP cone domain-containing protein [Candidatus Bathyarchaeota archaeon]